MHTAHVSSQTPVYAHRRPQNTVLYQAISQNWKSFLAQRECDGHDVPHYVREEFEAYLKCGILAHGFLRLKCTACRTERLVAFSCKKRGFCSSCGGRRMSETAAHLVDHVIPHQPIRQWVLSVPFQMRYWLSSNPKLQSSVLKIIIRTITAYYKQQAAKTRGIHSGRTGAITLIQRFGSALNMNVHFHILFLEGVYEVRRTVSGACRMPDENEQNPRFYQVKPPTDEDIVSMVHTISKRLVRHLRKKELLSKYFQEGEDTFYQDSPLMAQCLSASIQQTIALGQRKGQRVRKIGSGWGYEFDQPELTGKRCASVNGFSLHANTFIAAYERDKLEALCRYISRPAIAQDRLAWTQDGNITYRLKTPYRDGTTAVMFSPLEFIEKLVALVPRPRAHLIRFHGLLAPHAAARDHVVPKVEDTSESSCDCDKSKQSKKKRMSWAALLKRVFQIEIDTCSSCGAQMQIIAAITDKPVVRKILRYLNMGPDPPPIAPAKHISDSELDFFPQASMRSSVQF